MSYGKLAKFCGVVALCFCGLTAATGWTQQGQQEDQQEADPTEMAGEIGPENERLAPLAGKWKVVTTFEQEGAPSESTESTATIVSVLGGRFLQETSTGTMMGMPHENFRMWGYNVGAKRYEAVWAWTMSTGFLHLEGHSSDDGATIEWDAWYDDESGTRQEFQVKTTITDNDNMTIVLHAGTMPDGSAGPVLTSTYTRIRGASAPGK